MLANIIFGIFIGAASGLLWGLAFRFTANAGLLFGAIVGALLGLLITFLGKIARVGGNLRQGETNLVNTSILTMFGILVIGSGIIVWLIGALLF